MNNNLKLLHRPKIAVLIPAAGASKRIGSPKQLLKWGSSTLLGHSIETAQQLNNLEIFVVLGAYYENIKQTIEHFNVQVIKNKNWKHGLGSSIACGMNHIIDDPCNYDGVLIMLADQPLIIPHYLNEMINQFQIGKDQIIATSYTNGKHGVPALFDKKYFKELTSLNDDLGAKDVIEKHSEFSSTITINPRIDDIDSMEEYTALYTANHQ